MGRAGLGKNESHRQNLQSFPGKKPQQHTRSVVKCLYAKTSLLELSLSPSRKMGCSWHRTPTVPGLDPAKGPHRPGGEVRVWLRCPPGALHPSLQAVPAPPLPRAPGRAGSWPVTTEQQLHFCRARLFPCQTASLGIKANKEQPEEAACSRNASRLMDDLFLKKQ